MLLQPDRVHRLYLTYSSIGIAAQRWDDVFLTRSVSGTNLCDFPYYDHSAALRRLPSCWVNPPPSLEHNSLIDQISPSMQLGIGNLSHMCESTVFLVRTEANHTPYHSISSGLLCSSPPANYAPATVADTTDSTMLHLTQPMTFLVIENTG